MYKNGEELTMLVKKLTFLFFIIFALAVNAKDFNYKKWGAYDSNGKIFAYTKNSQGVVFAIAINQESCSNEQIRLVFPKPSDTNSKTDLKIVVDNNSYTIKQVEPNQKKSAVFFVEEIGENGTKFLKNISKGSSLKVNLNTDNNKMKEISFSLSGSTAAIKKAYSWCVVNNNQVSNTKHKYANSSESKLSRKKMKRRFNLSISPHEIRVWQENGFYGLKEIHEWKDLGVKPEEALDWERLSYGPVGAKKWKDLGVKSTEARSLFRAFNKKEAYKFIKSGFKLKEVFEWSKYNFNYEEVLKFKKSGFKPKEAREWVNYEFNSEEAYKFKKSGFSPLQARLEGLNLTTIGSIKDLKNEAKQMKNKTLVFKGFYLGMSIYSATKLLNHYMGFPDSDGNLFYIKKLDDSYSITKKSSEKYYSIATADNNKNIILFDFPRDVINSLFQTDEMPAEEFLQNFINSYNVPELSSEARLSGSNLIKTYNHRSDKGFDLTFKTFKTKYFSEHPHVSRLKLKKIKTLKENLSAFD